MSYISLSSIKSTPLNISNKKSSSEENLVTKNQFSLIKPRTEATVLPPADALAKAMKIANSVKSSMNTEYLLPHQFIKFPVNQENAILTDKYTLPPYENNRNRSAPLSIINLNKNNISPKDIKWDNTPMKANNSSSQTVNTKSSRFLVENFGINKLKHFFYDSINTVKSTGKIQALVIANKVIPREKDLYDVKFYNKKGTVEIQKNHKENAAMLNDVKNSPISFSGKEKEKFNQTKDLQREIHTLEKEILEINKSNPENIGNLESEFNYTKSAQSLIDECILSKKNQRDNKFNATIETMNGVVDKLKNKLNHLKKNQNSIINVTVENNIYKSNDSLNSDSSGYKSDISRSSNETQQSFTLQRKPRVKLLSRREEMGPNEQSGIESKKNNAPQRNISLAIPQVSSQYSSLNKNLNQKKQDIDNLLNSFNSDEKPSLTKGNVKSNKDNLGSSTLHTDTRIVAARKSTAKTKVMNRNTVGLEQTQAEKMARLTKGYSTTGYIHPSRRAQPTNAEKEQKIKQFDEQISKLLAMKEEAQAMLDVTTKEEKTVNQLMLETKNDVATLKYKLKA